MRDSMTNSDDRRDDGDEEEEYPELTRHTEMPEREDTGDGIKDEGVSPGYSEGILTRSDDDSKGDGEETAEQEEEDYPELERHSGMSEYDDSSEGELVSGSVPHGYGDDGDGED